MDKIAGMKVLVTGATGFIGGRVVEKLILEHKAEVRTLVRNLSRAARLARFDCIKVISAPINDTVAINNAIEGCDVVFHCVYDQGSESNNLEGIKIITDACIKHNVRLVHLSTISVYEPIKDGDLDETEKSLPSGLPYTDIKIKIEEEIFRKVVEKDLQAVILQPTIVYGPFGPWTNFPVQQLLSGNVILPDNGQGLCNAVYVDDVCDAMILSAIRDGVVGERYLISGSDSVTWGKFFETYESLLGVKSIIYKSKDEIRKMIGSPVSNIKLLLADPKQSTRWKLTRNIAFFLRDNLPDWAMSRLTGFFNYYKKIASPPKYVPTIQLLNLYSAKCQVRIDKAKRLLGYNPKYNFHQGMKLTAKYINWAFPQIDDLN